MEVVFGFTSKIVRYDLWEKSGERQRKKSKCIPHDLPRFRAKKNQPHSKRFGFSEVMADACKICFSIIHGKHYRTLSTKNSVETYKEVLKSLAIECQGKACYICANKLNRIVNLKSDIAEKQKKM